MIDAPHAAADDLAPIDLDEVALVRVSLPLVRPFRTSFGVQHVRDALLLRVRDVDGVEGNVDVGPVRFEHVAFNQREEPVYSGTRTALIRRRGR